MMAGDLNRRDSHRVPGVGDLGGRFVLRRLNLFI
jgi:hypothetical protein